MPTRKHYPAKPSPNTNYLGTMDAFLGTASGSAAQKTPEKRERIAPRSEKNVGRGSVSQKGKKSKAPLDAEKMTPAEVLAEIQNLTPVKKEKGGPPNVTLNPEKHFEIFTFHYGDLVIQSEKPIVIQFLQRARDQLVEMADDSENLGPTLADLEAQAKKLHNQSQFSKAEVEQVDKGLEYLVKRLSEISGVPSKSEEVMSLEQQITTLEKRGEVDPYAISAERLAKDHPLTKAAIEVKKVELKNLQEGYRSKKEYEAALDSATKKYAEERANLRR